ncbi:MAG: aldehyde dehydrogenase family protein [Pseudomonadota bacterium]
MNMLTLNDRSLFRQQAYINGTWCDADGGKTSAVYNQASGALLGHVPRMGASETRRAIEAGNTARQTWRGLPAKDRSAILLRWQMLMLEHCDDLSAIITVEQRKSLTEARGEIIYAAAYLEWFAEETQRMHGDTIPASAQGHRILPTVEPIGVCAAITPGNFPFAMIARKVGPALAAGCSMIVNPDGLAPFSALALAALAERAGVPAGVFNVVTGTTAAIGAEFTANALVRKLNFTVSTAATHHPMRQPSDRVKKLSLELGGNAPFIVFDDADPDVMPAGIAVSKFSHSRQACVSVNRIYVQDEVYDVFTGNLTDAIKKFPKSTTLSKLAQAKFP